MDFFGGRWPKHSDHNILPDHISRLPGVTTILNFVFITSLFPFVVHLHVDDSINNIFLDFIAS